MNPAREQILGYTRMALQRRADSAAPVVPDAARFPYRTPGDLNAELELFLSEIGKLGAATQRVATTEIKPALEELVRAEDVNKATLWETSELCELGVAKMLASLGVELVSPHADQRHVAECDLGVTMVDAALPETGTLVLRSSPERPRVVSLLPRVHLGILRPSVLRADLGQVLAEIKNEGYAIMITGPSRTADIELTVTIGVHGPKALHVWVME